MLDQAVPERLVLDASAAVAIVRGEPAAAPVSAALRDQQAAGGELVVPDHFWLELVNVLVRRYALSPDEVAEAIHGFDEIGFTTVEVDRPLLLLAIDFMHRSGLGAYDGAYLALAEAIDGRLLTLDARLAEAASGRALTAVADGGATSREQPAAYGTETALAAWAGFGAWLAELRHRAEAGMPSG